MLTSFLLGLALAADPQPGAADGPDVSKMPFTPESIKAVVLHHQPQIQGCYEDHLADKGDKKKAPEGRVNTSFVITAEGLVKGARVLPKQTTLKDPQLHACLTAVLSAMTFPRPPGGEERPIEFPFNLKAVH